jgi:hypothetical protein
MTEDEGLEKALLKRALGFYSREVTEEYCHSENGTERLVRRKVNRKFNPPDVSALRELLNRRAAGVESMTDGELEAERERLLKELGHNEPNTCKEDN